MLYLFTIKTDAKIATIKAIREVTGPINGHTQYSSSGYMGLKFTKDLVESGAVVTAEDVPSFVIMLQKAQAAALTYFCGFTAAAAFTFQMAEYQPERQPVRWDDRFNS